MAKLYSQERLLAFLVLLVAYGVVFGLLLAAKEAGAISFPASEVPIVERTLAGIPFIALYVVILIGVTAGYARAAFAARSLGLMRAVQQQLRTRSMGTASIKSKIRSDSVVTMDTPFLRTMEKVVTARLPILPVREKETEKIYKVITIRDVMQMVTHQIHSVEEEKQTEKLYDRLAELKVESLSPQDLVSCNEDDNLGSVVDKMMQNQFTRLVVLRKDGKACRGTVDLLDIVSEILSEQAEAT